MPVSAIATATPPPTAISAATASQIRRDRGGGGAAAGICSRAPGRGGAPTPSWVDGSFCDEVCSPLDDAPGGCGPEGERGRGPPGVECDASIDCEIGDRGMPGCEGGPEGERGRGEPGDECAGSGVVVADGAAGCGGGCGCPVVAEAYGGSPEGECGC